MDLLVKDTQNCSCSGKNEAMPAFQFLDIFLKRSMPLVII